MKEIRKNFVEREFFLSGPLVKLSLLLVLVMLLAGSVSPAAALTLNLQPGPIDGKDALVVNGNPGTTTTNYGSLELYRLEWISNYGYEARGYYQFDLSSALTPTDVITSAQVDLYMEFRDRIPYGPGPQTFVLESVGQTWDEGGITWNNAPGSDGIFSTSVTVAPTASYPDGEWVTLDITDLAVGWHTGSEVNNGFLLRMAHRSFHNAYDQYVYSSDYSADDSLRPILSVTYEPVADPSISDLDADPDTFNSDTGSTTISYTLTDVTDAPVVLDIYASDYNLVRSIDAGPQSSGAYSLDWDGYDEDNNPVAGGLYTARLIVTTGDGDGVLMNQARYLDTSPDGYVYVVDQNNNRILKFDTEGNFITKWGEYGSGDGQFKGPSGISVDSDGNVYVSDHNNSRIQKFDADGVYVSQFVTPWGIMGNQVDSSGNICVADHFNNRLLKYNPDGALLDSWGCSGHPWDVAIDSVGNVYVTSHQGSKVTKFTFTPTGTVITSWGSNGGQLVDIAIDSNDNVFVSDYSNHRVNVFTSIGVLITRLGTAGNGDGQFNSPFGLAFDPAGNLYVGDAGNSRIQKFSEDLTFVLKWGDVPTSTTITAETDILVDNTDDEPNIAIIETKKAKVCWHHGDIHVDGKLYLPEGVRMDSLPPVGSAVVTLAGVEVTDQSVDFEIKGKKGDKWEYKDKKNENGNIKEFKIDWKEARFDYKGDSKFHIHTHGIGASETILCIHTGDVSGAFTVNIDETTITYNGDGIITTNATYEPQKSDSHVHFTLPFKLTPDMTIEVTGAVELSFDVAEYYDEAYAKFKLVSAFDAVSFPDGTDTLPDTLEFYLTLGDDDPPVSWSDLIEAWTKQDDKHWEYK